MAGMFGAAGYGPSNWADTLTLIGAGLKDASPTSQGGNLAAAQQMLMQRRMFGLQQQALGQLGGLFGGQAAQTAGTVAAPAAAGAQPASSGPNFNSLAAAAPYYKMLGIDLAPSIEALKAGQPDVAYDRGFGYNRKSGQSMGDFHPDIGAGKVVTPQGVFNLPGYSDAEAQTAGSVENAKSAAQAGYDLVDVPVGNGKMVKMPRAIAAPLLAAQAAKLMGGALGAPGAPGAGTSADAGQLGVVPSPDEQALATERAKTQAEREGGMQGARSAMQQVDDQTNMIAQNLHDMLGETQDPQTGKWVKTKPSMLGPLSTGSQTDLIEHIPFLNQNAKDLEAKIETVRNGTSFNSMQAIKNAMAAAGDGGTASMRMTDQTARMLGEINGSLNQNQSGPQFEATVRRHLAQLDALNKARHDLFESQYSGIKTPTPGQTKPTANYNAPKSNLTSIPLADRIAEARRRGLIQ